MFTSEGCVWTVLLMLFAVASGWFLLLLFSALPSVAAVLSLEQQEALQTQAAALRLFCLNPATTILFLSAFTKSFPWKLDPTSKV